MTARIKDSSELLHNCSAVIEPLQLYGLHQGATLYILFGDVTQELA